MWGILVLADRHCGRPVDLRAVRKGGVDNGRRFIIFRAHGNYQAAWRAYVETLHALACLVFDLHRPRLYVGNASWSLIMEYAKCGYVGCNAKAESRGYCPSHYEKIRRSVGFPGQMKCLIDGCNKPAIAKGLCENHRKIQRKYGYIPRTVKDKNVFTFKGGICEITLFNYLGSITAITVIDQDDYLCVKEQKWHLSQKGYVLTNGIPRHLTHVIMGPIPIGLEIDHINHDTLDNRKTNLRIVNHYQNMANQQLRKSNTSGFKGVTWEKSSQKWVAQLRHKNKCLKLGRYRSKEEAALSYNRKAVEIWGEYASLNICAMGGRI